MHFLYEGGSGRPARERKGAHTQGGCFHRTRFLFVCSLISIFRGRLTPALQA